MDDADASEPRQQLLLDASIRIIRAQAGKLNINGDGTCEVCGYDVEPITLHGKQVIGRFCSLECRDRAK